MIKELITLKRLRPRVYVNILNEWNSNLIDPEIKRPHQLIGKLRILVHLKACNPISVGF